MALDLRGRGFGNILLMAAGHLVNSENEKRMLYHDNAEAELFGILDVEKYFEMTDDESLVDPSLNAKYCSLRALCDPDVRDAIQRIARIPEDAKRRVQGEEFDAGFCFRVTNPDLDGTDVTFMTDVEFDTMIVMMRGFRRPYACSNDEAVLARVRELAPHCVTLPCATYGRRNAPDHVDQWYALSTCPVIVHAVGLDGRDGRWTSTFAPTAAVYGPETSNLIGVEPSGALCFNDRYHW